MIRRALILLACLSPARAAAHRGSITYGDVRVDGRDVVWELQIHGSELAEPLGLERDAAVTRPQAHEGRERMLDYVGRRIAVLEDGRECVGRAENAALVEKSAGFAAALRFRFSCERRVRRAELRYRLFFDLDERHQSLTRIEVDGALTQHVFTAGATSARLAPRVTVWDDAADYLVLGVEHIFTGYDHICFLFALLLVACVDRSGEPRGLRRGMVYTLGIVTAFTAAHSLTLIVAALGVVRLPGRIVESAIALSIAWVAAENVLVREPRHRWLLALGFGLVHGFGFAGVLADVGLPPDGMVVSLLSFNAGVELGQATIVALVFPLLHHLARRGAQRWYRPAVLFGGSAVVFGFALLWFVERAFALPLFGGALG